MDENIKIEYNRLVLIGNGFDRALGLKTSYEEFIQDYIKKSVKKSLESQSSQNGLIKIIMHANKNPDLKQKYINEIENSTSTKELIRLIKKIGDISYKNKLLEELINEYNYERWVDIEQFYFETLKKYYQFYKKPNINSKTKDINSIIDLNKCMDELTLVLSNFIKEQEIKITWEHYNIMSSLFDNIKEPLESKYTSLINKHNRSAAPSKVLFLNFNYTNTLLKVLQDSFVNENFKHLFIHGSVHQEDNPIIFGYGDDAGKDYQELELEGKNELLRKIKSFQYPRTSNYHKLLNFLNFREFEVFIIGHSCGLSDRTLLKTIFEHPNCLAIRNFHYKGEQEDFEKRMEISRHFDNKVLMRERVLPFDEFASIPQYKAK